MKRILEECKVGSEEMAAIMNSAVAAADKEVLIAFCKTLHVVPWPKLTTPEAKLRLDIFFDEFAGLVNGLSRDAGRL